MTIDEQFAQLNAKIDALRDELNQKIEKVETTLLTEFHKWASPNEQRQRVHAAAMRALDLEIENHDDRLRKLEGREPLTPPQ